MSSSFDYHSFTKLTTLHAQLGAMHTPSSPHDAEEVSNELTQRHVSSHLATGASSHDTPLESEAQAPGAYHITAEHANSPQYQERIRMREYARSLKRQRDESIAAGGNLFTSMPSSMPSSTPTSTSTSTRDSSLHPPFRAVGAVKQAVSCHEEEAAAVVSSQASTQEVTPHWAGSYGASSQVAAEGQPTLQRWFSSSKSPAADRIRCQWHEYAAVLGSAPTNPAWHVSRRKFIAFADSSDQARCTDDELPMLGDMCNRHARLVLGLEVRQSGQAGAGLGLWSLWPRVKGELICEYKGNVRLVPNAHITDQLHGTYAIPLPEQPDSHTDTATHYVIDASRSTDGFARFINDFTLGRATHRLLSNCVCRRGAECNPTRPSVAYYIEANQQLAANTELSLSYGITYWTPEMLESVLQTK